MVQGRSCKTFIENFRAITVSDSKKNCFYWVRVVWQMHCGRIDSQKDKWTVIVVLSGDIHIDVIWFVRGHLNQTTLFNTRLYLGEPWEKLLSYSLYRTCPIVNAKKKWTMAAKKKKSNKKRHEKKIFIGTWEEPGFFKQQESMSNAGENHIVKRSI